MAYEKLTLEIFKKRLKDGQYESATGARRGVGKTDWSEKEKTEAAGLIVKHFGEATAAAKPKKAAAAAAPKGPKKGSKKSAAATAPVKQKKGAKSAQALAPRVSDETLAKVAKKDDSTTDETVPSVNATIVRASHIIDVVSRGLNAAAAVHASDARVDITEVQEGIGTIARASKILDEELTILEEMQKARRFPVTSTSPRAPVAEAAPVAAAPVPAPAEVKPAPAEEEEETPAQRRGRELFEQSAKVARELNPS